MTHQQHYNVDFLVSKLSEITEEEIMGKVQDASGSRVRVTEKEEAKPQVKPNMATNSSSSNNNNSKAPSAMSHVPKSTGVVSWEDETTAVDLQKKVRSDHDETNWMLLGYANASTLKVVGSGHGGFDEFASLLQDNQVGYGFLSVPDQVDQTKMSRVSVVWPARNSPSSLCTYVGCLRISAR